MALAANRIGDVTLTPAFEEKVRKLAGIPRLVQNVVVGAVNETVGDLQYRHRHEMKRIFDRPTGYVIRGLKMRKVGGSQASGFMGRGDRNPVTGRTRFGNGASFSDTPRNTTMTAGIYFEAFRGRGGTAPNQVMKPHVYGGSRRQKPFERQLQNFGLMPAGHFAVPGDGMPRNRSGNPTGGQIQKMLHDVMNGGGRWGGGEPVGIVRTKQGKYFIARKGKKERGKKKGGVLAFKFVNRVNYSPRYAFWEISRRQVRHSLPLHFGRILNRYIRSYAL